MVDTVRWLPDVPTDVRTADAQPRRHRQQRTVRQMSDHAPDVGAPAPDLELPTIDGGITALRDLQGRPVLVSFLRHAG